MRLLTLVINLRDARTSPTVQVRSYLSHFTNERFGVTNLFNDHKHYNTRIMRFPEFRYTNSEHPEDTPFMRFYWKISYGVFRNLDQTRWMIIGGFWSHIVL